MCCFPLLPLSAPRKFVQHSSQAQPFKKANNVFCHIAHAIKVSVCLWIRWCKLAHFHNNRLDVNLHCSVMREEAIIGSCEAKNALSDFLTFGINGHRSCTVSMPVRGTFVTKVRLTMEKVTMRNDTGKRMESKRLGQVETRKEQWADEIGVVHQTLWNKMTTKGRKCRISLW